jgi:hypothetical protein
MKDELLLDWSELDHFTYFCPDRIYRRLEKTQVRPERTQIYWRASLQPAPLARRRDAPNDPPGTRPTGSRKEVPRKTLSVILSPESS